MWFIYGITVSINWRFYVYSTEGNEDNLFSISEKNNSALLETWGRIDREKISQILLTVKCFKKREKPKIMYKKYNRTVCNWWFYPVVNEIMYSIHLKIFSDPGTLIVDTHCIFRHFETHYLSLGRQFWVKGKTNVKIGFSDFEYPSYNWYLVYKFIFIRSSKSLF